jgi:SAM-dependent methyltransferase
VATYDRERFRTTFDSAARSYHEARPDYPDALYDQLIQLTGITPDDPVLEIGAGTGKATLPLARRGYQITCVELGTALADEARLNLAGFPRVEVVTANVEEWPAEGRSNGAFGLIMVATAWHWIDPDQRYHMAARLLRPGGHLAFWSAVHVLPEDGDPFFPEIQEVYDEIGEGLPAGRVFPTPATLPDSQAEIEATGLFAGVSVRRFDWEIQYTAEEYIRLLGTFSGHITMEPW